jgi:hypothetical protein
MRKKTARPRRMRARKGMTAKVTILPASVERKG